MQIWFTIAQKQLADIVDMARRPDFWITKKASSTMVVVCDPDVSCVSSSIAFPTCPCWPRPYPPPALTIHLRFLFACEHASALLAKVLVVKVLVTKVLVTKVLVVKVLVTKVLVAKVLVAKVLVVKALVTKDLLATERRSWRVGA
jgi:hypothetical protein